jgi:hypothetical protein
MLLGNHGPQAKRGLTLTNKGARIATLKFFDFNLHLTLSVKPQPSDSLLFTGHNTTGLRLVLEYYRGSSRIEQVEAVQTIGRDQPGPAHARPADFHDEP